MGMTPIKETSFFTFDRSNSIPIAKIFSYEGHDLENRVKDIQNCDLSRVLKKCEKKYNMDSETLKELEHEYKNYLELRLRYPGVKIPMSIPVDPIWHEHILFSVDYIDLCQNTFGYYLHHKPCESEDEVENLGKWYRELTLPLYEKHFGTPSEKYWPSNASVCLGRGCT